MKKAIIHYEGNYEDTLVIYENDLETLKAKAYEEIDKRGWNVEDCWSEVEE